ncbi:MAG: asparaginase [Candidatus Eremiobacteraeota bacterium]|nr:asparaginase [Candidatus Eremiobacteraeota bacterium]
MAARTVIASAALGEAFVDVTRGGRVESVHRIAACAIDRSGEVLLSAGDIDVPIYLRSTAKPFIAAAVMREAVAERFGLEAREVAVIAGSHNGEPFHIEAVRSILRKIGLPENALRCGPHPPYDSESARDLERADVAFTAIHNNCSGKHAGILALSLAIGADPATYLDAAHPAQRLILALCARLAGVRPEELPLAIDGCGVPVYALSLRKAALSFARFAALEDVEERDAAALRMVRDAMVAHPEYVGGSGEFDTAFMNAAGESIAAKSGAEGVHGVALVERGVGLVLKVGDGNSRAIAPAVLHLLRRMDALEGSISEKMLPFEYPVVYNRAGRAVGAIAAR